jgi:hypothetical protein
MVLCSQIDKIVVCLNAIAPLIDRYQRGEVNFPDHVLKWLEEVEGTMSTLHLPEGAEMSSLRGRILKVADALPAVDAKPSRSAIRRSRNASAAEALDRAEAILRGRLLAAEERLNLFEDKLCEGITAFLLQNTLPDKESPYQRWLHLVWHSISQFQATRPLSLYLAASLSQVDRFYILDRVLSRVATLDLTPPESV